MRNHEIENWALNIVDRVLAGQPIEDVRVELKSAWIEPRKAARRIAGHANASRGEPILWVVGVDEKAGTIPGIDFTEFSNWYNRVKSCFDELAPEPVSLNVPANGVTIAVLNFETDRAPFVVKKEEGGEIQREVPWREATSVRSATRSQLIRLLSPLQKRPDIEVIGSFLRVGATQRTDGKIYYSWQSYAALLLMQSAGQQTVIPSHKCEMTFGVERHVIGPTSELRFIGDIAENVRATINLVTVLGPGLFEVRCDYSMEHTMKLEEAKKTIQDMLTQEAFINLLLNPTYYDHTIPVAIKLLPTEGDDHKLSYWRMGNYGFQVTELQWA